MHKTSRHINTKKRMCHIPKHQQTPQRHISVSSKRSLSCHSLSNRNRQPLHRLNGKSMLTVADQSLPLSSPESVQLYTRVQRATDGAQRPPLVIIHGLLGQGSNWRNIAARPELSRHRDIITPDMRNHGSSPHISNMTYAAMAADIARLIKEHAPTGATLVGHSMGGKAAAATALLYPELVTGLVMVDILPALYQESNMRDVLNIVDTVANLDLTPYKTRHQVSTAMESKITDLGVRQWLLTNIGQEGETLYWKPNVKYLNTSHSFVRQFDIPHEIPPYEGPSKLIYGEMSSFCNNQDDIIHMMERFPTTTLDCIPKADHWVHAAQPALFTASLVDFLEKHQL